MLQNLIVTSASDIETEHPDQGHVRNTLSTQGEDLCNWI